MTLKIRFKTHIFIGGMEYQEGEICNMPDWLAKSFIRGKVAEAPGISVLGGKVTKKPPVKKAPVKKPVAKEKVKKVEQLDEHDGGAKPDKESAKG